MCLTVRQIDALVDKLFAAEYRRRVAAIDKIAVMHNATHGIMGFSYRGDIYVHSQYKDVVHPRDVSSLAPDLNPEMVAYEKDTQELGWEYDRIRQAIGMICSYCETLQDLRDSLPDCLWPLITKTPMARQNVVGWCLRNLGRQYNQYMKIVPRMEMYSVTHLIY